MLDAFELFRYPIMWVCAGIQFNRFAVNVVQFLAAVDAGLRPRALAAAAGFITGWARC